MEAIVDTERTALDTLALRVVQLREEVHPDGKRAGRAPRLGALLPDVRPGAEAGEREGTRPVRLRVHMGVMLARFLLHRFTPVWVLALALAPGGLVLLLLWRGLKRSVEWP